MSAVHGSVALCTGDNELSLEPLTETRADSARGRALGTGYSWNSDALAGAGSVKLWLAVLTVLPLKACFSSLALLICLGPTGALVSRKKSNLEEGLVQRGESLGFGL